MDLFCFKPGIEPNQLVPNDCAVRLAKFFDKLTSEAINSFVVFHLKSLVMFFCLVSKGFNDAGVKIVVTRNEAPKTLPALFYEFSFVLNSLLPIATAIHRDEVFGRPDRAR